VAGGAGGPKSFLSGGKVVKDEIAVGLHDALVGSLAGGAGGPKSFLSGGKVVKDEIAISLQDQLIAAAIRYNLIVLVECFSGR